MADCNHKLVSIPFTICLFVCLFVCLLLLFFPFIYVHAPNKVKENSNIFLFQALFNIHCAVSYFGSVLWLK